MHKKMKIIEIITQIIAAFTVPFMLTSVIINLFNEHDFLYDIIAYAIIIEMILWASLTYNINRDIKQCK